MHSSLNDPWHKVNRLPNGKLELSFDAPLSSHSRVNWLKVRDWLELNYEAKFTRALIDPVTSSWSVGVDARDQRRTAFAMLQCSDFPDDLVLRVREAESEWLIHDIATRIRAERPDLGDVRVMDNGAFGTWIESLITIDG